MVTLAVTEVTSLLLRRDKDIQSLRALISVGSHNFRVMIPRMPEASDMLRPTFMSTTPDNPHLLPQRVQIGDEQSLQKKNITIDKLRRKIKRLRALSVSGGSRLSFPAAETDQVSFKSPWFPSTYPSCPDPNRKLGRVSSIRQNLGINSSRCHKFWKNLMPRTNICYRYWTDDAQWEETPI